MTKNKRFEEQNPEYHLNRIYDAKKGKVIFDEDVVDLLNDFNDEKKKKKKLLACSRKEANDYCEELMSKDEFIRLYISQRDNALEEIKQLKQENEQLKEYVNFLEKQCHLIHIQSMFSTVKSFKGDVSKRYKYSEERDTIYDTANNYGQYDKVLDKKEVVMLLNEYETILKEE